MAVSNIKMHYHNFTHRQINTEIYIVFKGKKRRLGIQSCIIFELKSSYKMFFFFKNNGYYNIRYHTEDRWLNYQGSRIIPYDKPVYIKAIAPNNNVVLSALEDIIYRNELVLDSKYLSLSNAGAFTGIKIYNIAHLYSDLKHIGV